MLLTVAALVGVVALASAQECPSAEEFRTCVPDWAQGRHKVLSNDTFAFSEEQKDEANDLFGTIVLEVLALAEDPNCAVVDSTWLAGVEDFFQLRGIDEPPVDITCLSELIAKDSTRQRIDAIRLLSNKIMPLFKDFNQEAFGSATSFRNGGWKFDFKEFSQQCSLEKITVFRAQNKWAALMGTTNKDANEAARDRERIYLEASLTFTANVGDRKVNFDDRNHEFKILEAGSGTLTRAEWGGIAGLSSVSVQRERQNPLLTRLLNENEQDAELASETLLHSNVAILAMPMVVNLVPSSALKLTSWFSILLYVVVTDFVTTLPFIVKGIELLQQSSKVASGTLAYHAGLTNGTQHIEIYSGECSLSQSPGPGVAFLVIGVLFLVTGILVEIVTHKRQDVVKAAHSVGKMASFGKRHQDNSPDEREEEELDNGLPLFSPPEDVPI